MNKRVIIYNIKNQHQLTVDDLRNAMIDSIDHEFDTSKYAQEVTEKIVKESLHRAFYEFR